jgi:hypothetical protein
MRRQCGGPAMRTRDELENALDALGWKLVDDPREIPGGWWATIQRGTATVSTTGRSKTSALEDLLRLAEAGTRSRP